MLAVEELGAGDVENYAQASPVAPPGSVIQATTQPPAPTTCFSSSACSKRSC